MKLTLIAVASTVFVLSLSAQAADMPGMKMNNMAMDGMMQDAKSDQVAKAEGTIKAFDTAKHTVTIAHGAVPTLQWPAMTMAFSATAEQLAGQNVGDHVQFEFRVEGKSATIVSMKTVK